MLETTVAASSLCSYPKIWATTPWEFAGSLQNGWVKPLLCIPRCTKSTKKTPKLDVLPELLGMQRRLRMWKKLCFGRWVTEEVETPWPGCHRCLKEQGAEDSPALLLLLLPAGLGSWSMPCCPGNPQLQGWAWIPSPFEEVLTPTVLLSLSIIITSPSCYSDD